jgi:hypothetical protein
MRTWAGLRHSAFDPLRSFKLSALQLITNVLVYVHDERLNGHSPGITKSHSLSGITPCTAVDYRIAQIPPENRSVSLETGLLKKGGKGHG